MEDWAPEVKFFWKRHKERALVNLKEAPVGTVNISLRVDKFKIDKSIENPKCICQACGGHLPKGFCENCTEFMQMHNLGWVYFVVDHFEGDDYTVFSLSIKK